MRGLIQVSAVDWVDCGDGGRARCGFRADGHQVVVELKNGTEARLDFGGTAPSQNIYAAVTLEGKTWIFEFPWILYRDVALYLSAS